MRQQILTGLGAGAAAALLYGSFAAGTPIAILLFYMASLPLFIAGLGWGWATAGLAAAAGAAGLTLMLGLFIGFLFLLAVGAPSVWLSYLAGLSRTQTNGGGKVEWYPLGRLVMWTAIMAGALVVAGVASFGLTYESYEQTVRDVFSSMVQPDGKPPALPEGATVDDLASFFVTHAPQISAVGWMATTLANLYAAARIVQISGRLRQPWPVIAAFDMPRAAALGLGGALVLSFVPGLFGLFAGAFAASLAFAYTLLGLAVMHTITRPSPLRPLILGAVYFTVAILGWATTVLNWPALLLALLGLMEGPLNVRARAPSGPGGRGGPPAPRGG